MDTPTPASESALQARLAQRLAQVVDEADHLLHTAALKGNHEYDTARDLLVDQMQQARRELAQMGDTAMYKARRAVRAGDRTVRDHPYAAIGIAGGIGALVGWLLNRR